MSNTDSNEQRITDQMVKDFLNNHFYPGVSIPLVNQWEQFKSSHISGGEKEAGWEILECYQHDPGITHFYDPDKEDGCFKQKPPCKIHSVRRRSDNEVFSIGDWNEYPTGFKETIKEFRVSEIKDIEGNRLMCFRTDTVWSNIALLNKTSPPQKEERKPQCGICGGETVFIRGKYPNTDKRPCCPTCTFERLEQIQEISSPYYGQAAKEPKPQPSKL